MKTIEQIQGEIDRILTGVNIKLLEESLKQEILLKRQLILYLETGVTEEYLLQSLLNLQKEVEIIDNRCPEWMRSYTSRMPLYLGNPKRIYEDLSGLRQKKTQIKTLQYLLS